MNSASIRQQEPEPSAGDLAQQIRALQDRVTVLEEYLHVGPAAGTESAQSPALAVSGSSFTEAVPVAGRVLLGIAGAYVLRSLTESQAISHAVGVATGFLYAAAWMYLAVRTASQRRLAAMASALTSILILGPLLFEAAQRFHAITSSAAAGVMVAFAVTAVVLCWNRPGSTVPVIVTAGSATFALVLLIALRDLLPFTLALLTIAAAVEFAACFDRETSSRPFLALAADIALLICALVAGRPEGLPEGYAAVPMPALVASQMALLIIYVASTAARTIVQQRKFTNFETVQTALAFAIGLGGALRIAQASGTAIAAVGLCALAGGAGCYVVSFVFVGRAGNRDRNFFTYATFALLLTLAGSDLLFSGVTLVALWAVYALACCWAGLGAERHVLELHASVALLLALVMSGVAGQTRDQLFGDPMSPVLPAEWIVAGASLLACLAVARNARLRVPNWDDRLAGLVFALTLSWSVTGFVAHGLSRLAPGMAATWGTLVLVGLAAGLALACGRWGRSELRVLVFLFAAVAAYKLLAVDLRQPHTLGFAVSLLLYGGTLILLPRLLRSRGAA